MASLGLLPVSRGYQSNAAALALNPTYPTHPSPQPRPAMARGAARKRRREASPPAAAAAARDGRKLLFGEFVEVSAIRTAVCDDVHRIGA